MYDIFVRISLWRIDIHLFLGSLDTDIFVLMFSSEKPTNRKKKIKYTATHVLFQTLPILFVHNMYKLKYLSLLTLCIHCTREFWTMSLTRFASHSKFPQEKKSMILKDIFFLFVTFFDGILCIFFFKLPLLPYIICTHTFFSQCKSSG